MKTAPAEIAASGIEKHEIRRRIVKCTRQQAGQPKIHSGDWFAVGARHQGDPSGQCAIGARAEDRDRRSDRKE